LSSTFCKKFCYFLEKHQKTPTKTAKIICKKPHFCKFYCFLRKNFLQISILDFILDCRKSKNRYSNGIFLKTAFECHFLCFCKKYFLKIFKIFS